MNDFEQFFRNHYEPVVGSLRLALPHAGASAEDAAQVAFTKAALKWRAVARMDRPATWVYVVAARELRRQVGRDMRLPGGETPLEPLATDDPAAAVATTTVIEQMLDRLTARQRLAVVLRFEADLTVAEVAKAMGCAIGTAKSTLHEALSRLRIDATDGGL
jgi:RNA polymerase sigma factor (sigma-70 family)